MNKWEKFRDKLPDAGQIVVVVFTKKRRLTMRVFEYFPPDGNEYGSVVGIDHAIDHNLECDDIWLGLPELPATYVTRTRT